MNLVQEEGTMMHSQIVHTVLAFCVCAAISVSAGAQVPRNTPQERVQTVLSHLEEHLGKIRDFHCRKVTPQIAGQGTDNPTVLGYTHEWLSADNRGRGRVTTTAAQNRYSLTWDGERTIEQREETAPNGAITRTAFIVEGLQDRTQRQNEPWVYLGSDLANMMGKALAENSMVRVSPSRGGLQRVDVRDETGRIHTALLDPKQGYAPVYRRLFANGKVLSQESVTFEQVQAGIWFPFRVQSEVDSRTGASLANPALKFTFTNATINTGEFARGLSATFAKGTLVQDRIRGVSYVVGQEEAETVAEPTPSPVDANAPAATPEVVTPDWRTAFNAAYQLDSRQGLKCIAPPFIPERAQFLVNAEPALASPLDRAIQNRVYRFQWATALGERELVGQNRYLTLSDVLENIIGLRSYEYEGLPYLLRLPLTGDWIVERTAAPEQLLTALEPIVKTQTQRSIQFVKEQAGVIIVRASGTYQFTAQAGATPKDSVHMFAGQWNTQTGQTSNDCGTLGEFLASVANSIGMQIIDETESSQTNLCWVAHKSAELKGLRNATGQYNAQVAGLLNNLAAQTGLTFQIELGAIERWRLTTPGRATARSN